MVVIYSSGQKGRKKTGTYTLHSLVCSTVYAVESKKLTLGNIFLNLMLLFLSKGLFGGSSGRYSAVTAVSVRPHSTQHFSGTCLFAVD